VSGRLRVKDETLPERSILSSKMHLAKVHICFARQQRRNVAFADELRIKLSRVYGQMTFSDSAGSTRRVTEHFIEMHSFGKFINDLPM